MNLDPTQIKGIVEAVVSRLAANGAAPAPKADCGCSAKSAPVRGASGTFGVFGCANQAATAANDAFLQLKQLGVAGRARVIEIVKAMAVGNAEAWGRFEMDETKIGRVDHKIGKLQITKNVPGVEWLRPYALSGDGGITLEEYAPYGVIGAILPVTHSVPTLTGNVISMVAAGNAVVFNPHPGGARSAAMAVRAYNEAIYRELGIENLITTVEQPSLESFDMLCKNPDVAILAITGGPAVVNAAMKSGKRAICAGPGNPTVVVDETANLAAAARHVIEGGAFDNNLLCIGEKAVFVLGSVYNKFCEKLQKAGAARLNSQQLEKLTAAAFTFKPGDGGCSHAAVNRALVGADPAVLAQHAGASVPSGTQLLFAETDADHAFVQEEQMMPMIPIVPVPDFATAVREAKRAEHGYRHSAIIHTKDVDHMTYMAKEMDTTIFVKNGPSVAGLGLGGEGYLSYSIATTTGEGITTPKTFTRIRRCVLVENLRII
ncbi:MAG: aldehyde dehydrogenase EutE [Verrucomicrobia bacterium]|nr:aldehyde dehydrogenase EutE [Verrucomicrobiota bacterium]